eukprot:scaffold1746_cov121-Isochrysis_galbana.AAC.4
MSARRSTTSSFSKMVAATSPPSSWHLVSASGVHILAARIASAVCSWPLRLMSALATGTSLHPRQMRSICRAAELPSEPAATATPTGRPSSREVSE